MSHFGVRIDIDSIDHPQFAIRRLKLRRIVGKNFPAAERVVFTGLAINRDAYVCFFIAIPLARSHRQRGLHGLEDDGFIDAFLVRDRFNNQ